MCGLFWCTLYVLYGGLIRQNMNNQFASALSNVWGEEKAMCEIGHLSKTF